MFNSTLFKVNTDGSGYQALKMFTGVGPYGDDGSIPGLVLSGSTLYGTIPNEFNGNGGLLFQINGDGSGYQPLTTLPYGSSSLLMDGTTLYGIVGHPQASGTAQGEVFSLAIPEPSSLGLWIAGWALLPRRRTPRG